MRIGRKIIALVTVFLMIFGTIPMTIGIAAEGAIYDYTSRSQADNICIGRQWHNNQGGYWQYFYEATFTMTLHNTVTGVDYNVMCMDENTHSYFGYSYTRQTLNLGDTAKENHIRGIMFANPADSGIANLTSAEITAARQGAIWHFSNNTDLYNGWDGTDGNKPELYALYAWFLGQSQGPVGTTTPAAITIEQGRTFTYNAGFTTADIEFRYQVTGSNVSGITPTSNVPGVTFSSVETIGGWNYVTAKNVPVNSDFTIILTGNQSIQHDVSMYTRASSQTMVGFPFRESVPVTANKTLHFGNVTVAKQIDTNGVSSSDAYGPFSFIISGGLFAANYSRPGSVAANGSTTISGIPYFDANTDPYTITENGNISNYHVSYSPSALFKASENPTVTITNEPRGSIIVTKAISGGSPAAGDAFTFRLYKSDGETQVGADQTITAPATTCTFSDLPFGNYKVVEVSTTPGYTTQQEFTVGNGMPVTVNSITPAGTTCTNTLHKRLVTFVKVVDNGDADDDTVFTLNIFRNQGATPYTHVDVSAAQPQTISLPFGSYTVQEVVPDGGSGYQMGTLSISSFTVDEENLSPITVTAHNTLITRPVTFVKVVDNGAADDATVFTLNIFRNQDTVPYTHVDVSAAQPQTISLPFGSYTVQEVAPSGNSSYQVGTINNSSFTVGLENLSPITVTAHNTKIFGSISIHKAFQSGNTNPNETFTVNIDGIGDTVYHRVVTLAADGTVQTFNDLPYNGAFQITETSKSGYELVSITDVHGNALQDNKFYINSDFMSVTLTVTNKQDFGSLIVNKAISGGGAAAPNDVFTFKLYKSDGTTLIGTKTITAPATSCTFSGLEFGNYIVFEQGTSGYLSQHEFVVGLPVAINSTSPVSVTCTNTKLGAVNIKKVVTNFTGSMPNFQVVLTGTLDGQTIFSRIINVPANDTSGVSIDNMPYGHYTLSENLNSSEYNGLYQNISITPSSFDVNDSTKFVSITVTNKAIGSIRVVKLDSTSTANNQIPVPGTHFEVYYMNGDQKVFVLTDGVTDQNGVLTVGGLDVGMKYYAHEIKNAPGYNLVEATREYLLTAPGQVIAAAPFVNSPVGKLMVEKRDSRSGALLGGFQFAVYATEADANNDANRLDTLTTATSDPGMGTAVSKELILTGASTSFWVKEIANDASKGYKLDSAAHEVIIDSAGRINEAGDFIPTVLKLTNEPYGTLVIKKVDALDEAKVLTGAEFTLYYDEAMTQPAGNAVTTGDDGIATFTNLDPGKTYWLMETKAPADYIQWTEPINVTELGFITFGGDPVVHTFTNQYNPPEPIQTGTMDYNVILIGGLALLAGLLLVLISRKRRMKAR